MNAYLYQYIVGTPILLLQAVLVVLIILLIIGKAKGVTRHFKKYGMVYGLIAAIAAMVGSLGFSEGFGYTPCKLCWVQRIFHYPQVILFAVALYYKDARVWTYSIWLSVIGFIVAGYQVLLQYTPAMAQSRFCSLSPSAESCSDILIQVYGFTSIPVMSLTLFAALIVLFIFQKKK